MDSNIAIEARHASKIYELRSKEKKVMSSSML